MSKWKVSLLLVVGGVATLAQTASQLDSPPVQRVAKKLMCSCGCKLDMTCLMPPGLCGVCQKGKAKIYAMQTAGKTDAAILDEFAKEEGRDSLILSPGAMGMIGPCAAISFGLGLVVWTIRKNRRPDELSMPEHDPVAAQNIEEYLADGD